MVCAQSQRPQSTSHRAMPATPEAQRYPHEEAFGLASARIPIDRTSTAAVPTNDRSRPHHGYSGPRRPPPCRSPHEFERCILPTDAKDRELCASRSYGRCLVALYNDERPHEALGNATPADHYNLSARRWDGVLREPEYGAEDEVRRVRQNGEIKWRGNTIYITTALIGEPICLRDDANGRHTVFFGPVVLGMINHGEDRLRKPRG